MSLSDLIAFTEELSDRDALALHRLLARRVQPLYAKAYRREYEAGVAASRARREAVSPAREREG